jgi:hypothetical protein
VTKLPFDLVHALMLDEGPWSQVPAQGAASTVGSSEVQG